MANFNERQQYIDEMYAKNNYSAITMLMINRERVIVVKNLLPDQDLFKVCAGNE